MPISMRKGGAFFIVISCVMCAMGIGFAASQSKKLKSAQSTTASVLSTEIVRVVSRRSKGRRSVTYRPVVDYQYQVNGQSYKGDSVFPINLSQGHDWATDILNRFEVGEEVPVFYNPEKPNESFLLKEPSFFPYLFILFTWTFSILGAGLWMFGATLPKNLLHPRRQRHQNNFLVQVRSIGQRLKVWTILLVLSLSTPGIAFAHYFSLENATATTMLYIVAGVYLALSLAAFAMASYNFILSTNLSDAIIRATPASFQLGSMHTFEIHQKFKKRLDIEDIQIGLICTMVNRGVSGGRSSVSRTVHYEKWTSIKESHATAGPSGTSNFSAASEITIPRGQPQSSPHGMKMYPRYEWALKYIVTIHQSPDYKATYPINVTGEER